MPTRRRLDALKLLNMEPCLNNGQYSGSGTWKPPASPSLQTTMGGDRYMGQVFGGFPSRCLFTTQPFVSLSARIRQTPERAPRYTDINVRARNSKGFASYQLRSRQSAPPLSDLLTASNALNHHLARERMHCVTSICAIALAISAPGRFTVTRVRAYDWGTKTAVSALAAHPVTAYRCFRRGSTFRRRVPLFPPWQHIPSPHTVISAVAAHPVAAPLCTLRHHSRRRNRYRSPPDIASSFACLLRLTPPFA
ncbi:hypothetical protein C8R45DRAFT_1224091 [Mycena sanguinolenta]|nr:hypothetical protein C8R45DRAFT_1224091 [Mycena sanguinolenta]